MCTATWWTGFDGYELFFNRDELRTRAAGMDPEIFAVEGVRYLAPTDATAGGTWVYVNEYGVSGCLINQYPRFANDPGPNARSRGLLLRELADCASTEEAADRLHRADLSRYQGFLILVLSPDQTAESFRWDTVALSHGVDAAQAQPFTSSSALPDEVMRVRRYRFAELIRQCGGNPRPEDLRSFHLDHDPESGVHSVFMSRPDAETVSLTHVVVDSNQVTLEYAPRTPGAPRLGSVRRCSLSRLRSPAEHGV